MIAVDGNSIDGSLSLVAQVRERSVGDNVTLTALRDGQGEDINVIFGAKATTCQQRRGLEPDTLPAQALDREHAESIPSGNPSTNPKDQPEGDGVKGTLGRRP
jgi:hypothetical protein